ncbi:MAG: RNA polymerase sigma factor [Planctomycetia bacterium]
MSDSDEMSRELAACLERLAGGDAKALDAIIELVSERLRLLAHRMLGRFPAVRRWEDTDDVFQNASLRLYRALGSMTIESPRSIMALAATQVQRELIDLARRHAGPMSYAANHGTTVRAAPDASGRAAFHVDASPATDANLDRWTLFHEAIDALPADLREVFHLVWYLGAEQKAIAALLGCSERTVKSRWRAAREAVRAQLGSEPPR